MLGRAEVSSVLDPNSKLKHRREVSAQYHEGNKLAATNSQYPVVPRIRAFFEPNTRTTNEATREKHVNDVYNIPSEIVPKFPSCNK